MKNSDVPKGNSVFRFDSLSKLIEAIFEEKLFPENNLILAQELHQPKSDQILRIDTLNGNFLAAHKVFSLREPSLSWEVELRSEAFEPEVKVIHVVEEIVRAARIDLGSIEFFEDSKTNDLFFYGLTPFNYRKAQDPEGQTLSAIGDYVEKRLHKLREFELAL